MGAMMARLMPSWLLAVLTWRNHRLRERGLLPDEWYWADVELLRRGLTIDDYCKRADNPLR